MMVMPTRQVFRTVALAQIGPNHMCVTHPPEEGMEGKNAKYATRSVLLQILKNGVDYGVTQQYYGTEDGILHLHPATRLSKCRFYDPRFA